MEMNSPVGPNALDRPGIVGEPPNLAMRLQGLAEPNMGVTAEST